MEFEHLIGQDIGRYRITEILGLGGMSVVYKAFDRKLETDVAIKIIRSDVFPPAIFEVVVKRFEREAKLLARLVHPNIVRVIDYGVYKNEPYLVMPYVPGGTLKDLLQKRGRLPWREAVRLLIPIARALGYAHTHGVIHRDVKPSNILISESGEPMLTDFGIAKVGEEIAGGTLTTTGMAIGTPEYMAPEQWTSREVDWRVDEYALGVVLYESITGTKPYTANTPGELLIKQTTGAFALPSTRIPGIPKALERVIVKALAKDPNDRYRSMNEFAAALEGLYVKEKKGSVVREDKSDEEIVLDVQDNEEMTVLEATQSVGVDNVVNDAKRRILPCGRLMLSSRHQHGRLRVWLRRWWNKLVRIRIARIYLGSNGDNIPMIMASRNDEVYLLWCINSIGDCCAYRVDFTHSDQRAELLLRLGVNPRLIAWDPDHSYIYFLVRDMGRGSIVDKLYRICIGNLACEDIVAQLRRIDAQLIITPEPEKVWKILVRRGKLHISELVSGSRRWRTLLSDVDIASVRGAAVSRNRGVTRVFVLSEDDSTNAINILVLYEDPIGAGWNYTRLEGVGRNAAMLRVYPGDDSEHDKLYVLRGSTRIDAYIYDDLARKIRKVWSKNFEGKIISFDVGRELLFMVIQNESGIYILDVYDILKLWRLSPLLGNL